GIIEVGAHRCKISLPNRHRLRTGVRRFIAPHSSEKLASPSQVPILAGFCLLCASVCALQVACSACLFSSGYNTQYQWVLDLLSRDSPSKKTPSFPGGLALCRLTRKGATKYVQLRNVTVPHI